MNKAQDILLGLATGDALGVPVEFKPRSYFEQYPVTDMQGFGTHNQKPGTWSDDSSLAFCLAESLILGYDLKDISKRFIQWLESAYWTAHGVVFDCGITTGRAIDDLRQIIADRDYDRFKTLIDEGDEYSNGNGSLMRIAPLLFFIKGMDISEQFEYIKSVSALTHRHIRSAIACLIHLKWMEFVLEGKDKVEAYEETQKVLHQFLINQSISTQERNHFARLLERDITNLKR
ncbi:MAG: ADP-ribosylglycohydrolase family protein, partial [Bacteroidota bacterium]